MLTCSTERVLVGAGSGVWSAEMGLALSSCVSRAQLCWAPTKPRQLAMASSTGAREREVRIELVMITPPVALFCSTR